MDLLTDLDSFNQLQSDIEDLIMREKHIPNQVFQSHLSNFAFMNSDEILFAKEFVEGMKSFLSCINDTYWFLAVLEPDPEGYFFRHFGKYPIIEVSVGDSPEDFQKILQDTPKESPADAIAFNSTVILIFSPLKKLGNLHR